MTTYSGTATPGVPAIAGTAASSATAVAVSGITTSGPMTGVYGEANGTNAAAVAGVANGTLAIGVYGKASAGAGCYGGYFDGFSYGAYGKSLSLSGIGGFFDGNHIGVQAYCEDYLGYGVYALAPNFNSSNPSSTTNTAVYGKGFNTGVFGSGTLYGVYGVADSGAGYGVYAVGGIAAGYFSGKMEVHNGDSVHTGTGAKTFKIDHPLDPENRFLVHATVESPEQKNIYDGTVVTDLNGEATVTLPDYFEALNGDIRYQLTAIGGPARDLHIKSELLENKFTIGGAKSRQKISWQVTGVRHDPTAKLVPFTVERDKSAEERGLFLSPEAHGHSVEKGIGHQHTLLAKAHDEHAKKNGLDKVRSTFELHKQVKRADNP